MIKINDLTFSYKTRNIQPGIYRSLLKRNEIDNIIFSNLSTEIFKNEKIIGLLGRNGAGKTTLIKLISGILTPNKGNIEVFGLNTANRPKELLKNLGVVFGNKSMLWEELSIMENIELFSAIYKIKKDKELAHHLIKTLSLDKIINKPAKTFSLGQSVKGNLLIHLLNKPALLILDEPTIGLDIEAQIVLRKIFKDYLGESDSKILITSHNMLDIAEICEDILFVNEGEIDKLSLNKNHTKEKKAIFLEGLFQ